jgi:hypothetical protein
MFEEPMDLICARAKIDTIERNTEMSSQNEKHFKGLRDRVEHSFILPSSLPELDCSSVSALVVMTPIFRTT